MKQIAAGIAGTVAGGILGVLATAVLTWYTVRRHPDDPSAGSVGILITYFLPAGLVVGCLMGLYWSGLKR